MRTTRFINTFVTHLLTHSQCKIFTACNLKIAKISHKFCINVVKITKITTCECAYELNSLLNRTILRIGITFFSSLFAQCQRALTTVMFKFV